MTTCLGKSCSFGLPRMPIVNCCQFMFLSYFPGFEGRMWDLIVSVADHCLSFYFPNLRFFPGLSRQPCASQILIEELEKKNPNP